ncbi:MAG: nucleotide exchange factor GrpE [Prevotella sp.]|nr:nucleotide exchange factor GrpE [Candidatus Prevotella equi]
MKKEDINTVENEESVEQIVENTEEAAQTNTETEEKVEETEPVDPLEAAKAEIEELKKQALYKQAEFENYRKRTIKEKADLILAGGEKTITAILPILDDFERAMADKSEDPTAIREGMQLIFNKFTKTLESLGVKKIETQDADFNVDFHESIALVPGMGDDKKGKVIDCVQTGYTLNDKVIRYAKVAVGQ